MRNLWTYYGGVLLLVSWLSLANTAHSLPPVQGTVVMISNGVPGTMVIVDDKGQNHVLHITQQTQLGAQFKVGDKVIAYFSPYGVSAIEVPR